MKSETFSRLAGVAARLEQSSTDIPFPLKMRTAELILRLMARRKRFGLFVILGWQRKWRKHLDISDSRQDIFAGHHIDIMRLKPGERRAHDVSATADFDGAILIDRKGEIVHSGAMIEGLRPSVVAQKLNPGRFKDLSEQFGFDTKVHTRHLTAIAASYVFKGTTVFTVSEENDSFHVFEGGKIIHHVS
ncbi:MAG: DisA bacterial checkpoint controller nucleotide-binding [Candidatus Parcubacteria bacterium]|jgi:DNA integrity scanning protein DisA with diadenylate cyclase activity